jgi:hypothetical protein
MGHLGQSQRALVLVPLFLFFKLIQPLAARENVAVADQGVGAFETAIE